MANLVLSGKKERNYLDVYTQTTKKKKKVTKTKPHPLQSRVVWERPSRNWPSFLYLPERHMAGSYSWTKLSLNSRSEGHGGAGRGAVRTGPALGEYNKCGFCLKNFQETVLQSKEFCAPEWTPHSPPPKPCDQWGGDKSALMFQVAT